jgi:hypothetical protein
MRGFSRAMRDISARRPATNAQPTLSADQAMRDVIRLMRDVDVIQQILRCLPTMCMQLQCVRDAS